QDFERLLDSAAANSGKQLATRRDRAKSRIIDDYTRPELQLRRQYPVAPGYSRNKAFRDSSNYRYRPWQMGIGDELQGEPRRRLLRIAHMRTGHALGSKIAFAEIATPVYEERFQSQWIRCRRLIRQ